MAETYSEVILEHYRKEAELHGRDASSTMRDEITRGREVAAILRTFDWLTGRGAPTKRVVDIGCGNGYLLEALRERAPAANLVGVEYTPEMCAIARDRKVKDVSIVQGDVRALPMEDASCDLVITERCIINVMDRADQATSLREVGRVLAPGGHFICLEARRRTTTCGSTSPGSSRPSRRRSTSSISPRSAIRRCLPRTF
jgi:ubiquinone/menaquinone biosynthesis C-methylase UbiE